MGGGIFTGIHEFNIERCLDVCSSLGLPFYADREAYSKLSNKAVYKNLFYECGLPKIREFYSGRFSGTAAASVEFPAIVKPVDGSGGAGVKVCHNRNELEAAAIAAAGASASKEILVEEFLDCPEVTVWYVAQDGNIMLEAMADRITERFDRKVIPLLALQTFPSAHLDSYAKRFDPLVKDALRKAGARDGSLFIQAFWKDESFYIYDMGYRLSGVQSYNLISAICGYNPLELLVDYSLTGRMGGKSLESLVDPRFKGKKAAIVSFLMRPGKIKEIRGEEEVRALDNVIRLCVYYQAGDALEASALGTLRQVAARAFIVADTQAELEAAVRKARGLFSVIGEDGRPLDIAAG